MFSPNKLFFTILFWETGPCLWKSRPISTFCLKNRTGLIPGKNVKTRDLEISKIPNIEEVNGIYLASPRGLRWGKAEPPDYILMFCSANVPGITYRINFGDCCPSFFHPFLDVVFDASWFDFPSQLASQNPLKSVTNRCQDGFPCWLHFW